MIAAAYFQIQTKTEPISVSDVIMRTATRLSKPTTDVIVGGD